MMKGKNLEKLWSIKSVIKMTAVATNSHLDYLYGLVDSSNNLSQLFCWLEDFLRQPYCFIWYDQVVSY